MTPEKIIKGADKGMRNLTPRIRKLREESYKLEVAYNKLWAMKYQAQLKITPIQIIPNKTSDKKKLSQIELENIELRILLAKMEDQMKRKEN